MINLGLEMVNALLEFVAAVGWAYVGIKYSIQRIDKCSYFIFTVHATKGRKLQGVCKWKITGYVQLIGN